MNTYLPDPDFSKSAVILDDRKLNRQRADVIAILKSCLEDPPKDGSEHPAIRMWRGSEQYLIRYGLAVCFEWQERGNSDTLQKKIMDFISKFPDGNCKPEWLGDRIFHESHQSYLLRLLPSYYKQRFDIRDDLPMIWPRSEERTTQARNERERQKLVRKAEKARERAVEAQKTARVAALEAGLHPDTLDPLSEEERVQFKVELEPEVEPDQLPLITDEQLAS